MSRMCPEGFASPYLVAERSTSSRRPVTVWRMEPASASEARAARGGAAAVGGREPQRDGDE